MARNLEIDIKEENPKFPKNLFLSFPKLPFNRKSNVEVVIVKKPNEKQFDDEKKISNKPDMVKFSEPRPAIPPPLKLEAEEPGRISNRIILWQVSCLSHYKALFCIFCGYMM